MKLFFFSKRSGDFEWMEYNYRGYKTNESLFFWLPHNFSKFFLWSSGNFFRMKIERSGLQMWIHRNLLNLVVFNWAKFRLLDSFESIHKWVFMYAYLIYHRTPKFYSANTRLLIQIVCIKWLQREIYHVINLRDISASLNASYSNRVISFLAAHDQFVLKKKREKKLMMRQSQFNYQVSNKRSLLLN